MVCSLVSIYFHSSRLNWIYNENELLKPNRLLIQRYVQFWFFRKRSGNLNPNCKSQSHFMDEFSRKTFFILHSINWPDFVAWLALPLKILGNLCIVIIYFPGCEAINLALLSSRFRGDTHDVHCEGVRGLGVGCKAKMCVCVCVCVCACVVCVCRCGVGWVSFKIGRPMGWKKFGHRRTGGGASWKLDIFHGPHMCIIPYYMVKKSRQ